MSNVVSFKKSKKLNAEDIRKVSEKLRTNERDIEISDEEAHIFFELEKIAPSFLLPYYCYAHDFLFEKTGRIDLIERIWLSLKIETLPATRWDIYNMVLYAESLLENNPRVNDVYHASNYAVSIYKKCKDKIPVVFGDPDDYEEFEEDLPEF